MVAAAKRARHDPALRRSDDRSAQIRVRRPTVLQLASIAKHATLSHGRFSALAEALLATTLRRKTPFSLFLALKHTLPPETDDAKAEHGFELHTSWT